MREQEIPPDGIVRTALQLLPVPGHEQGFWQRLERSLDDEAGPAQAEAPAVPVLRSVSTPPTKGAPPTPVLELRHDPALALVPKALRRTSNALLVAVAAAAVVVVALAGNALLDERATEQVTADREASGELDALVDGAQGGSATASTMSSEGEDASTAAVMAWVDDLSAGDEAEAWAAMGPSSQTYFGSRVAFEEQLASLENGFGAWSGSEPDEVLIMPVVSSGEGELVVVTLVGTILVDGAEQHRADAFPVRFIGDETYLEVFAFAGELEVVVPAGVPSGGTRPPVAIDEELVVVVPSAAEAPVLRLDDGVILECGAAEGTELTTLEGTSGQRCSYRPEEGLSAGEHTLTVAFLSADGTGISAESLLFEAA